MAPGALLASVAADEAWRRFLPGYAPPPVPEVRAALEPVETHEAAAFLARLAAVDLLWPSHRHLPIETADRAAEQAVSPLGPEAGWRTSHDIACGAVNEVTPLFDSLSAGTDGEPSAPALQAADDRGQQGRFGRTLTLRRARHRLPYCKALRSSAVRPRSVHSPYSASNGLPAIHSPGR
ncbi:hypothetical protein AB0J38_08090 [Streptomyces sp. NPDC050095]|uniref:hypothetical protein n=1 Tax=unclassified Streptomyces TaxID=2593676 RepID=UPI0034361861